jgi:hypothetical protein
MALDDGEPKTLYEKTVATGANGVGRIGHIARVNITQTGFHPDLSSFPKRVML